MLLGIIISYISTVIVLLFVLAIFEKRLDHLRGDLTVAESKISNMECKLVVLENGEGKVISLQSARRKHGNFQ